MSIFIDILASFIIKGSQVDTVGLTAPFLEARAGQCGPVALIQGHCQAQVAGPSKGSAVVLMLRARCWQPHCNRRRDQQNEIGPPRRRRRRLRFAVDHFRLKLGDR